MFSISQEARANARIWATFLTGRGQLFTCCANQLDFIRGDLCASTRGLTCDPDLGHFRGNCQLISSRGLATVNTTGSRAQDWARFRWRTYSSSRANVLDILHGFSSYVSQKYISSFLVPCMMIRYTYLVFLLATLFELLLSITLLALFACAYPDRFHTVLWQDGGTKGWNSDPHERVYYYANYREAPPIPWIWDERCRHPNFPEIPFFVDANLYL